MNFALTYMTLFQRVKITFQMQVAFFDFYNYGWMLFMFQVFKISISLYLLELLIMVNLHTWQSSWPFLIRCLPLCNISNGFVLLNNTILISCLSYDVPFKLDLCFLNFAFWQLLFGLTFLRNLLKRKLKGSLASHRIFRQRGRTEKTTEISKSSHSFHMCTLLS